MKKVLLIGMLIGLLASNNVTAQTRVAVTTTTPSTESSFSEHKQLIETTVNHFDRLAVVLKKDFDNVKVTGDECAIALGELLALHSLDLMNQFEGVVNSQKFLAEFGRHYVKDVLQRLRKDEKTILRIIKDAGR